MKNLKSLNLNDAKVLTSQEMKHLKGGSAYCFCRNDTSPGFPVEDCDECRQLCSYSGGMQNCNYISHS